MMSECREEVGEISNYIDRMAEWYFSVGASEFYDVIR